jgi:hypothetical protein
MVRTRHASRSVAECKSWLGRGRGVTGPTGLMASEPMTTWTLNPAHPPSPVHAPGRAQARINQHKRPHPPPIPVRTVCQPQKPARAWQSPGGSRTRCAAAPCGPPRSPRPLCGNGTQVGVGGLALDAATRLFERCVRWLGAPHHAQVWRLSRGGGARQPLSVSSQRTAKG